jgi:signal transduction histidine kinase
MFRDRKRFLFALPLVALTTGAVILSYNYWEYREDAGDTRRLYEAHADSVAAVVEEGAREAALSTSILYELAAADDATGDGGAPAAGEPAGEDAGTHAADDRAALVAELRRETGIGPLLKGVVREGVLYAALQDETGIQAVAPSPEWISSWAADPELPPALARTGGEGASRLRRVGAADVFERLLPFAMPDESRVLLRVGIDAGPLVGSQQRSARRFVQLAALVSGAVLLVGLLTALLWRWQSRDEEHARALDEQRVRSEHWEAIGQLAATVAHEVRNPLNTIEMVSQRLRGELTVAAGERAEFETLIATLRSESARVNRVVTGFLELGRPLRLNLEEADLGEALAEATAPGNLRAEREGKRLVVETRFPGRVTLDRVRFRQIIGNLADNALDAVPAGGRVAVEAGREGGALRVVVKDDGPGLSAQEARDAMKPFVSTKASGIGLGLPLVVRLAEAHGGTFELVSRRGAGAEARVSLPLRRGADSEGPK